MYKRSSNFKESVTVRISGKILYLLHQVPVVKLDSVHHLISSLDKHKEEEYPPDMEAGEGAHTH